MHVVLLTNDLMVASRVDGAAQRAGATLSVISTVDAATNQMEPKSIGTVIVDLSTPSVDVAAIVAQVRTNFNAAAKIIAFGPHVHESLLAAARSAGCDEVISRGQFFAQLDALLQRAISNNERTNQEGVTGR